jgi:hypothetical protein
MTVHPKWGKLIVMSRQSKEWLACATVLPAILLLANLGVAGAKVIRPEAPYSGSKTVFDADYVVGLAKLGSPSCRAIDLHRLFLSPRNRCRVRPTAAARCLRQGSAATAAVLGLPGSKSVVEHSPGQVVPPMLSPILLRAVGSLPPRSHWCVVILPAVAQGRGHHGTGEWASAHL